MTGRLWFVVPGGIDDPTRPSGGNVYDRKVSDGLSAAGWQVVELEAPGAWPEPDASALSRLRELVAGVPDDGLLLVDGLVGCAAPEVLLPERDRLGLVPLVHMPLGAAGERTLLQRCPALVTTSGWAGRRLVHHHGIAPERVHVAEPGVDMADPAPGSDGGGRLLCVAAVTPGKGHDVLLASLARLGPVDGSEDLDWVCTLVGSLDVAPEFVAALRQQAVALGIADRLRFEGPRSHGELDKAYAEADVLVLASRSETYGMVVTEALAHGLPVIATAVGGVPEALGKADDGSTPGLLVRPDDPAALAAALRRWLDDALLRRRLRHSAGMRRLTLSTWSHTCTELTIALTEVSREALP